MTQTMNMWNDLPTEILDIITTYIGRDCRKVKWMFVNKRWFTFYLSKAFYSIETSLGTECKLKKIFNSSFNVGKYVKRIHLSDIQKPKDLDKLDIVNDPLSKIMNITPNVRQVSISRKAAEAVQDGQCLNCTKQDWPYFSIILLNVNCWNLQSLPTLGERNRVSAAYYYTCAHYSRLTLKILELSYDMLGSRDFYCLKEFTALTTLEVHENLIKTTDDLDSLLQFTPQLQELIVRFSSDRVYQTKEKEYITYQNLKKLWLYNFTPRHNNELLMLTKGFPALENLYIFSERGKAWLSDVDDPSAIETFFKYINSIAKYEIMMPGDTTEIEFSKAWLKSIEDSERDIHLLHSYGEAINQNHTNFQSAAVATFYGGLTQSIPLLKHTMMKSPTLNDLSNKLRVLDDQIISCFRILRVRSGLESALKAIVVKERTSLKKITISDCTFEAGLFQTDTTSVIQHIKRIIFHNCKIDFFVLKAFIKKFESLDAIEFDSCTFTGDTNKLLDFADTDIKSIKMNNFRKMLSGVKYNGAVQILIIFSIYFVTQKRKRYFSIVDGVLIEAARRTFVMFRDRFDSNEVVVLDFRVKSMQELSLRLTQTSKIFDLSLN